MGTHKFSEVDGHIRGRQIDIEFNEVYNNKPQEIKFYNVVTIRQKLHLLLVIIISLSLISDFASIAASINVLNSNSTWTRKRNEGAYTESLRNWAL